MPASRRILLSACLLAVTVAWSMPGLAANRDKDAAREKEAADAQAAQQAENVRVEYAQVLNVNPVYETVNARRSEVVCDDAQQTPAKPAKTQAGAGQGHVAKWWGDIKGWFGGGEDHAETTLDSHAAEAKAEGPKRCRSVPRDVQLSTPTAYDVDYVYRGMKFRARLPQDPGNRLRIRLTVAPYGVDSQALDPHD